MFSESKTQQRFHLYDETKDKEHISNQICDFHLNQKYKILYYRKDINTFDLQSENKKYKEEPIYTYSCNIINHYSLQSSLLYLNVPRIVCDSDYEIYLPPHLILEVIQSYMLEFNGKPLDVKFRDKKELFFNYFLSDNKDIRIFNATRELGVWTNEIDIDPLSLEIEWTYKDNPFPLNICTMNDKLYHKIKYNLNILDYLKIREKESKIEVDFDDKIVNLESKLFEIPQLEGIFTQVPNDCSKDGCLPNSIEEEKQTFKEYFVTSSYITEDKNIKKSGETSLLEIPKNFDEPIFKFMWGAVNLTRSKKEKRLILTYLDKDKEKSPILHTSISRVDGDILDKVPSYKTETNYHINKKTLGEIGYNFYETNLDYKKDKLPVGELMAGGTISIKLKDNLEDEFLCFVILVYTKVGKFTTYCNTEAERNQNNSVFVL